MTRPADPLANVLGRLDGARVPGGCDTCNAYQTVNAYRRGLWCVTVHHDDWCPTLAAHTYGHPAS